MIYSFAIIAFLLGAFAYLVYRQRKKKASDTRSHHTVLLDGFPIVHIPISLSREKAEEIATKLQYSYIKTWATIAKAYKLTPDPMPIATIGTSLFEVDPEHPHVKWILPGDKVFLRVQPQMYYWFARELHNIFRYQLHGQKWIYETKDEKDQASKVSVEKWIESRWGIVNG